MRVFLDTNIILDLLLERPGFELSAEIFSLSEKGKFELAVSVLTMVNVAYVYRKTVGQAMATVNLKYLSAFVHILPMDEEMLSSAVYMEGKDFDDVLQAVCAEHGKCDCIITRNTKDYNIKKGLSKKTALPKTFTPATFLNSLK